MLSKDEFLRAVGQYSENPDQMFRALRGRDALIEPWEWISEASPFVNDELDGQAAAWAQSMVYYNAWAGSVGRPAVTVDDLARGGLSGPLLAQACEAVLTFPAPQRAMTPGELAQVSEPKLRAALGTYQAQVVAAAFLEGENVRPQGFSTSWDASTQAKEVAIAKELERRSVRS
jgi:hypothetical protein